MNRERRIARPYRDISRSLTDALDSAVLVFGDKRIPANSRHQWDDSANYGEQAVILEWRTDDDPQAFLTTLREGCSESGLPLDGLALVVTATSRYLGFVDILFNRRLDELDQLDPALDLRAEKDDAAAWKTSVRGCRVDAYLLLSRTLQEQPLRPWRKGVWLSKASFVVATDYTKSLFRPTKLDADQRKRLDLSAQVLRHVRLPESVWEEYDPEEPPEVYLDEEIMALVAAQPKALSSRLAQAELVYVFLRSVLTDAYVRRDEWKELEWGDIANSLLGKVLRAIAGRRAPAAECARLMDDLATGHLERLVSECEGATEIRALLRGGFGE